ncbi:MAG: indole-3-glycerol-phosphate synthase [Planctomycetes bacterium]|nr:indole-3-glycerol-phosphate synthase [Planctomycetota bacterium]
MVEAPGRLGRWARESRDRAAAARLHRPALELEAAIRAGPPPRPFAARLLAHGPVALIAEYKRASPSAGPIRLDLPCGRTARAYQAGGAAAMSVLTEGRHFQGSLAHLEEARAASTLPLLRKDFLVDPYQVLEARAAGADAVLLIVALLGHGALGAMMEAARSAGVEALVEVHDEADLDRALEAGATLVGINHRDLRSLAVDPLTTERLAPGVPAGVTRVSESGLRGRADLARLAGLGVHAVLVGEHLMRAADPEAAVRALVAPEGPR